MTTAQSVTEEFVDVAGLRTQMFKGGTGAPLLVLHSEDGNPGWMPHHQALSERFTVYAPSHPGYDGTPQSWVRTVNDVAHFYIGFMQALGLDQVSILGHSMGGWIAAEIGAMCAPKVKGMVLVDALGSRPEEGQIAEVFMVSREQMQELNWHDSSKMPEAGELSQEQQEIIWRNREMSSRLLWKPYMHNPNLSEYLRLVRVSALVVWGRQDAIVPVECGEIYNRSLQGSSLHVIDNSGHSPHLEQPQEFLNVTRDFLSKL